jgi:hypothetical protein
MTRPFNKIEIEFIDHDKQRYSTAGDWRIVPGIGDEKVMLISVSKLSDWRREALIAVHELYEVLLCENDGVTQEMVDKFDMEFERHRHPDNEDEPGDDPSAPYLRQHCAATGVERMLAAHFGLAWKDYERELSDLP